VIDTFAVADQQQPVGQGEVPPNGDGNGQTKGGTEGDTSGNEDSRVSRGHVVGLVLLLAGAIGILLRLFLDRPESLAVTSALVVLASSLLGVFVFFVIKLLPVNVYGPLAAVVGVAVTSGTLIATLLTIPRETEPQVSGTPATPAPASTSSSSPPSPSPSPEPDPFTAKLKFGPRGSPCEGLVVHKKLLRPLSKMKPKDIDAKWAYENGGATQDGKMILTIQGKSRTAVIIDSLRVVDFERRAARAGNVKVLPCNPQGGLQTVRYFEVDLDKHPRVIPRPSDPDPNPDYKQQPAAKFPFKVSRSDPEVFELWVSGPDCLCTWRLAIDWTSGDRSETTYLDHGFDKIRTITNRNQDLPSYSYDSQEGWVPPLPK
jgi:hypothetical protein